MVTSQSSELGWEVTVELPADFLSLGRGSVKGDIPNFRVGVKDPGSYPEFLCGCKDPRRDPKFLCGCKIPVEKSEISVWV